MSVHDDITTMWTPGPGNGFLPSDVPGSPEDVAALPDRALRLLGLRSPILAKFSEPEIDAIVAELADLPEVRTAALPPATAEAVLRCYVCLAAHLIHRPGLASRRALPAPVARPLWELSERVGRPPSLTYASYVLSNFTAPVAPRTPAADLAIGQTPSGTSDEEWFVAVHLAVESAGGEVVTAAETIDRALADRDGEAVAAAVESIESCLAFATLTLPTVRDRLDPRTFRDDIRPLLYGHEEIAFQGVPGDPEVTYIGETGAQSGIIRAADAVLGTTHTPAMVLSMDRFLACAPPSHQRYLAGAAAIGTRLAQADLPARAREARRRALTTLAGFRRTHLNVVADYLAPEGTSLSERGTGGTHFQVWLQRLIDETDEAASAA